MYRKLGTSNFCCKTMVANVYVSDLNIIFDNGDAEDKPIHYISKFDEYGIPISDGSQSMITVQFCPWCGMPLPQSKRKQWFDLIESMGLSPEDENIPLEFLSQNWWEQLS